MAVKKNDKALVAAAPETGALVDFWPHPLTSEGRRQSVAVVPDKGASLAEVLRQSGLALGGGPVEARVDGAPVARDQWPRRRVLPGQIVEARAAGTASRLRLFRRLPPSLQVCSSGRG